MRAGREDALARARQVGVTGLMLAGVDADDWRAAVEVQRRHRACAISYGVHPQVVPEVTAQEADRQIEELGRALRGEGWPRPQAVGEIGLDRATPERIEAFEAQRRVFREQLALAREHDLPVLLHILRAHGPALEILRRDGVPAAGGVVHSYSGSAELVRHYVDLGLHISFAGYVTRPNARRVRAAVPAVPEDRLLVETDAPDQTPLPHVGPNEPAWLPSIIEAVAALRGVDPEVVAARTAANARRLYRVGDVSAPGSG